MKTPAYILILKPRETCGNFTPYAYATREIPCVLVTSDLLTAWHNIQLYFLTHIGCQMCLTHSISTRFDMPGCQFFQFPFVRAFLHDPPSHCYVYHSHFTHIIVFQWLSVHNSLIWRCHIFFSEYETLQFQSVYVLIPLPGFHSVQFSSRQASQSWFVVTLVGQWVPQKHTFFQSCVIVFWWTVKSDEV